jgi:hypothetical protein
VGCLLGRIKMEIKMEINIDDTTYHAFQKLKEFVEFVGNLEFVKQEERNLIPIILRIIENLNETDKYQTANITLDIFDYELQSKRTQRNGVYWRTWGLYMEKDLIEIVAASHIDDVPSDDIDTNYFYQEDSFFLSEKYYKPIPTINYFDAFVEDAKKYKSYITKYLKELEIDICV